ncbi:MAG TPA: PASTA domain-containing protein [Pyrinomonadaceae bacterium]|nr:PASTA domain-containing protein [Pyrinomonadaceae bacterium]
MSLAQSGLSIFGKLSIIIVLLGAFLFGLGGTLYMALRSPEVKVPEVVGKDFLAAEKDVEAMGLKLRKRTDRFSQEKPNTILEQAPLAGESVKAGQTISVVIARAEAEAGEKAAEVKKENVNDNSSKAAEEPQSEVEKSRQKRKAANKNTNANKNGNSNAKGNSNANSNADAGGNSNAENTNSRPNTNVKNSNSGGTNTNSRPAAVNSNPSNRPATSRTPEANRRDQ